MEAAGGVRLRKQPLHGIHAYQRRDGGGKLAGDRAASYGLPKIVIDGNDADEVYRTAQEAYAKARAGEGPSLIECLTYRHSGHSRADPGDYRPPGELEAWLKKDPVPRYRNRLAEFGIDRKVIDGMDAEVLAQVDEATEISKASPAPGPGAYRR